MPMPAEDIVALIKAGIPDAQVEMEDLAGQASFARMAVLNADLKNGGLAAKLRTFAGQLEALRPPLAMVAE